MCALSSLLTRSKPNVSDYSTSTSTCVNSTVMNCDAFAMNLKCLRWLCHLVVTASLPHSSLLFSSLLHLSPVTHLVDTSQRLQTQADIIESALQARWDAVVAVLQKTGTPREDSAWWFFAAGMAQLFRYVRKIYPIFVPFQYR
jgi:hypothetical protein